MCEAGGQGEKNFKWAATFARTSYGQQRSHERSPLGRSEGALGAPARPSFRQESRRCSALLLAQCVPAPRLLLHAIPNARSPEMTDRESSHCALRGRHQTADAPRVCVRVLHPCDCRGSGPRPEVGAGPKDRSSTFLSARQRPRSSASCAQFAKAKVPHAWLFPPRALRARPQSAVRPGFAAPAQDPPAVGTAVGALGFLAGKAGASQGRE